MKLGVTVAYARVKYNEIPSLEDHVKLVEWAKKNEFESVEVAAFSLNHFKRDFSNKAETRKLVDRQKSLGLSTDAFEVGFLRNITMDQSRGADERLVEYAKGITDVARTLETDLVYGHTAAHPSWKMEWKRLYDEYSPPSSVSVPDDFSWDGAWTQYVDRIRRIVEIVEQADLLFALEIRPYEIVPNSDAMLALIKSVGSRNLGLIFDTGHLFVQKEILAVSLEKLRNHVFLIHLADNDGFTDYHWAPGKGKVDWERLLKGVKKTGYSRFLNIDVAGKYDDIEKEIIHGRDYVRKLAEKIGY
jgi:sugar phosphate isomerase/epimerase